LITVFFILYLYGADRFWLSLEILQVLLGEKIGESPSVSQQKNEKKVFEKNLFFLSFKKTRKCVLNSSYLEHAVTFTVMTLSVTTRCNAALSKQLPA
jgi:hypothetical protein